MQSKTSFFNAAIFKKNISRTWIVGLIYFIILLLILPVAFIVTTANHKDDWYAQLGYTMDMRLYDFMSHIPIPLFTMIVAIVIMAITFWYMFSKRDNYMMHAFPVSRKSLYFTGICSGFIVAAVPVVLVAALTTITAVVKGASALSCIWYWALIMIVATLLFESIAMFSLMCSGQLVTGVLFYLIFNFLYMMMQIAVRLMEGMLMFGMGQSMDNIENSIFSPSTFITEHIRIGVTILTDDTDSKVINFTHSFEGVNYLIIYAVTAIVIFAISYALYKYKKLETVQDFISVPFMKPVFSVGMSFFISMVAGSLVGGIVNSIHILSYESNFAISIVAAIIIGAIIYFATQMLIEKTLRVFCLKKALHCLVYSVTALVILLCFRFDVFNVENYIPKQSDIEWAGVQADYSMVFSEKDDIAKVRDLHQNLLDNKKELRNVCKTKYTDVPSNSLTIKYKLKDGRYIIRNYNVVDTKSEEVSPQYVASTQPILDFINEPINIKTHIIGEHWKDYDIIEMMLTNYSYNEGRKDYDSESISFDALSTNEKNAKFKKVYEALLKDIDDGHVFIQTFGQTYDNPEIQKVRLYNDFSFTVKYKNEPYFSDSDTFWDSDYQYTYNEQSIYTNISTECVNTLKALKDEGFYTDDSQLVTYQQYNEVMGYNIVE